MIERLDEETREALEKTKAKGIKEKLELGLSHRQDAKSLEEEAKAMKETADILLGEVFAELKVDKIKVEGIGSLANVDKERVYYDINKVKEYLVGHGVSATVVKNAVKNGEKKVVSRYIEFRRPRKGGKK